MRHGEGGALVEQHQRQAAGGHLGCGVPGIGLQDRTVRGLDLRNRRVAVQMDDPRQQQARIHRRIVGPTRRDELAQPSLGIGDLAAGDRGIVQEAGGETEFTGPTAGGCALEHFIGIAEKVTGE